MPGGIHDLPGFNLRRLQFDTQTISQAMTITFFVPGIPKPGGSKRAFWRPGMKHAAIVDACKGNKNWRALVALFARQAYQGPPLEGEALVEVTFFATRPANHLSKRKSGGLTPSAPLDWVTKPDATKLWRAAEDAMTGIIWRDDSQIIHQHIHKAFGDRPGMQIRIEIAESPTLVVNRFAVPQPQSKFFAHCD